MVRIFLAHAKEDEEAVIDLYNRLKHKGYKPWLDKMDLLPGQSWQAEISKAIKKSDVFIACLSSNSVAKKGYVQRELKMALNECADRPPEKIYLIPLRLDDCQIPELRQEEYGVSLLDYQWVDLFTSDGFDRLVESLEIVFADILGKSDSTTSSNSYVPVGVNLGDITVGRQRVEQSLKKARLDLDRKRQGYIAKEDRTDVGPAEDILAVGSALGVTTLTFFLTGGISALAGALAGPAVLAAWEKWKRSKKLIRYAPISVSEHAKAEKFLNEIEQLLRNGYVVEAEAKIQQYKASTCRRS